MLIRSGVPERDPLTGGVFFSSREPHVTRSFTGRASNQDFCVEASVPTLWSRQGVTLGPPRSRYSSNGPCYQIRNSGLLLFLLQSSGILTSPYTSAGRIFGGKEQVDASPAMGLTSNHHPENSAISNSRAGYVCNHSFRSFKYNLSSFPVPQLFQVR